MTDTAPDRRYYGLSGAAKALGVSRQRALQLRIEGKLPRPDALVDGRPAWARETFDRFAAQRRAAVAATPIGLCPSVYVQDEVTS